MRKLLRNRENGAFLADEFGWTTNKEQACDFKVNGVELEKLYRHEFGDVEWCY